MDSLHINDYYRLINYKIKQVFHTKYPTFMKFSDNKAGADIKRSLAGRAGHASRAGLIQ